MQAWRVVRGGSESLSNVAERGSAAGIAQDLAFILLLVCVAAAALPTGAVYPGGQLAIEIDAFAAAALAFAARPADERPGAAAIPLTCLIAIALIGAVQLIPMSMATLRAISPVSAEVYEGANGVLRLFGRPAVAPRISIAPTDTESTILLTLAYAALFSASAILANTRQRRRWLMAVLFATCTLQVMFAAATSPGGERLHGAFVNPNHLAGYLQIPLAFALGMIWTEVLTGADRGEGIRDRADRLEKRVIPFVWRILVWSVLATGMALTRSRGGLLAALITVIVMLAMGIFKRQASIQRPQFAAAGIGAVALGVLFVVIIAGQASLLRFVSSDPRDIGTDTRVQIWQSSLHAWRLFPNFGSGLGTFREAFRRVQPAAVTGLVEQAHNDFLQLLVTAGWIGAALGAIAFGSLFAALLSGWLQQRHREESAFILAALGALLALTLHGLFEFNMSIPAIPATLAIMLGAACNAARQRAE